MKKYIHTLLARLGITVRVPRNIRNKPICVEIKFINQNQNVISGNIVSGVTGGQEVFFFVADPEDEIQKYHFDGRFYEEEELALISEHFTGGIFLDVGANVGNHTLFALKFLDAERVIAVEPNPAAFSILKCNLALNDVEHSVELHKVGLSDTAGRVELIWPKYNLGGARMIQEAEGLFETVSGDSIVAGRDISFIKIDAESMEMNVIAGLRATIERCRPKMFVEVDDLNVPAFSHFCDKNHYRMVARMRRYAGNINIIAVPE
jgi:FkbM family methyltransferase